MEPNLDLSLTVDADLIDDDAPIDETPPPARGKPTETGTSRLSNPPIQTARTTVSDSGGFEGSQKTLTLKSNQGATIEYYYEHYSIPDNFIIRYQGQNLLETGFVGGSRSGKLRVPKGQAKEVEIIVATNNQGTAWEYVVTALDCPDTKLLNIDGQFQDEDEDGDCEAQGTIFVGRSSGNPQLIRAEGTNAEFNDTRLKVTNGTVFAQIGNVSQPLFRGSFEIPLATAKSSSLQDAGGASNEFKFAGLDVKFTSIALNPNAIQLGGEFELPQTIVGSVIKVSSDAIIVDNRGVRLGISGTIKLPTPPRFRLFNLLTVSASDLKIGYEAPEDKLKIQGKFTLNQITRSVGTSLEADLTGDDNFIQIQSGKADLSGSLSVKNIKLVGGWGLDELKLTIDTTTNTIGGDASVQFPFGKSPVLFKRSTAGVGVGVLFKDGELDQISGTVDIPTPGIPLGSTGLFLDKIGGSISNLARSASDPIEFAGDVELASRVRIANRAVVSIEAGVKINSQQLVATGKATLFDSRIASIDGNVTINWRDQFLQMRGNASFFDGAVKATAGFKADSNLNFNMSGGASIVVPESVPVIGGKQIASGNYALDFTNDGSLANDYVAAWGQIQVSLISVTFTAGFKGYFDGRFELLGPNGIPSTSRATTNSFPVANNTAWLLLSADWETANSSAQVRVRRPDGTVINEADFTANNIAVVSELSDSDTRTVIINRPTVGNWDIEVVNSQGLGAVTYSAYRNSIAPTIEINTPAGTVAGGRVNIDYTARDADSSAKIKLFYDTDNQGFDGIQIADGLLEKDGRDTFVWNTQGVPTGNYFIYAMITDDNNAPVMSYSTGQVRVTEATDLSIAQTTDVDSVGLGRNFKYRLTISNASATAAAGVRVVETLPAGVTFVSSSIAPVSRDGNTLTFDIGSIAARGNRTIDLNVVAPNTPGTLTSSASVTSQTFDANIENDTATLSTAVQDIPKSVDLAVRRTEQSATVTLNNNFTYTLVVTNTGADTASNVILTETIPTEWRCCMKRGCGWQRHGKF